MDWARGLRSEMGAWDTLRLILVRLSKLGLIVVVVEVVVVAVSFWPKRYEGRPVIGCVWGVAVAGAVTGVDRGSVLAPGCG